MLFASVHKSASCKVVRFGSLGWISMIQVPFNSSCVALQYETGTKFFHLVVPEGHFHERLQTACTKEIAAELMNVSRLWDLDEKKVEELLCLIVFVWSPRRERWPR